MKKLNIIGTAALAAALLLSTGVKAQETIKAKVDFSPEALAKADAESR
jgi:hypothetical protein